MGDEGRGSAPGLAGVHRLDEHLENPRAVIVQDCVLEVGAELTESVNDGVAHARVRVLGESKDVALDNNVARVSCRRREVVGGTDLKDCAHSMKN